MGYDEVALHIQCIPTDCGVAIYSSTPSLSAVLTKSTQTTSGSATDLPVRVTTYSLPKEEATPGSKGDRVLLWSGFGSQTVKIAVNAGRVKNEDILIVEAVNGTSTFVPIEVIPIPTQTGPDLSGGSKR